MKAMIRFESNDFRLAQRKATLCSAVLLLATGIPLSGQEAGSGPAGPQPLTAAQAPKADTSFIDAHGAAHVTRVVPVPTTISPQAQLTLGQPMPDQGPDQPLAERRKQTDAYTAGARAMWSRICPNELVEDKMAGVPVRVVTPEGMPEAKK